MTGGFGRGRRRTFVVAGTVVAAVTAVVGFAIAVPSVSQNRPYPTASPVRSDLAPSSEPWARLLQLSTDLGESNSRSITVLVTLRSSMRPIVLGSWANAHHLGMTWDHGARFALLDGTARNVARAFGVSIDNFRSRTGESFYAATSQAVMPVALRTEVSGIGSITNYGRPVEELMSPDFVPTPGLDPSELLQAYEASGLASSGLQGQGETVVFMESGPVETADLQAYDNKFGLPAPNLVISGGDGSGGASESGEADMDIETVHAEAPQAKLVYFNLATTPGASNSTDAAGLLAQAITDASTDFPGAIISASLGICELGSNSSDIQAISNAAQQAESSGSTIFASSGDTGGADCGSFGADSLTSAKGVVFPAVAPNVTGVGGTTLSTTSTGSYVGETTWSSPMMSQGSGGGVSTIVSRPSWQTGPGVGSGGVPDMREVPDVGADADPVTGIAMISNGQLQSSGGTSLSAPIWAGLTVLLDQYLKQNGQSPIGFANPLFYKLAADTNLSPSPFHQVTVGGNVFYQAGPGYNPITGVGTPDTAALAVYILAFEKTGTP
ncbi:MAG: S53 family peptidase [Acidimicrobiales bacterium]